MPNRVESKNISSLLARLQTKGHSNIVSVLNNCSIKEKKNTGAFVYALTIQADTDFITTWLDSKARAIIVDEMTSLLRHEGQAYAVEMLVSKRHRTSSAKKVRANKSKKILSVCERAGIAFTAPKGFGEKNYAVSEINRLAYDVTTSMLLSNKETFSGPPLVTLYGKSGVGKTHLLNALSEKLTLSGQGEGLLYCDIASFLTGFRKALLQRRERVFFDICRDAEYLLLDDLHYLTNNDGEESHQTIVFDLLNNFVSRTKPTIITCEDYPDSYRSIKARITTRLKSGLVLEIKPPDYDLRYLILEINAKEKGLDLSPKVLEYLAERIRKSPRDLVGAINAIRAHIGLGKESQSTDIRFVTKILADEFRHQQKIITFDEILQAVSRHFDLNVSELTSKNKSRKITYPRYLAMYLARERTNMSFPDIAKKFNMHHTSVMHGYNTVSEQKKSDTRLKSNLIALDMLVSE